jgi:hypothetical protein
MTFVDADNEHPIPATDDLTVTTPFLDTGLDFHTLFCAVGNPAPILIVRRHLYRYLVPR